MTDSNYVSVRELKNRLSEYLRRVAAGEVVTVTSHKRAIARLVPVNAIAEESPAYRKQAFREHVQSLPWVQWTGGKPQPRSGITMRTGDRTVAQDLLDDRR